MKADFRKLEEINSSIRRIDAIDRSSEDMFEQVLCAVREISKDIDSETKQAIIDNIRNGLVKLYSNELVKANYGIFKDKNHILNMNLDQFRLDPVNIKSPNGVAVVETADSKIIDKTTSDPY